MKVRELIEELQKLEPESRVIVSLWEGDSPQALEEANGLSLEVSSFARPGDYGWDGLEDEGIVIVVVPEGDTYAWKPQG